MAERYAVVTAPQVDGGLRLVAVSDEDAEAIRRDRAMLNYVAAAAIADLDSEDSEDVDWIRRGPYAARAAILEVARG